MAASEEISRLIEESRALERRGEIAAAIQCATKAANLARLGRRRGSPALNALPMPTSV